jgi:glycine cleavage system H lipoate-binding protein
MTGLPDERPYRRERMWTRTDGRVATVGMTDYPRAELLEIRPVEGDTLLDSKKYRDFIKGKGDG